ncbi:hypothetical protein AYO46_08990 [Betaproteobacteria bacterium SCGC AG-212-J23]|nr:hypothetical protein AYO46_08990 [Betaproteobacteria bacterium SCGC AG-212-J23]
MLVERRINADFSRLLSRFTPNTVFMHVGAASCDFAILAASFVERVYVVDPASVPERGTRLPVNLRLVAANEEGLPIPEGTIDIALTEDPGKLRFIRRCLVPGGVLLSPDRALSNALRDAGYSRIRVPWFNPLVEAMR